MHTKPISVTDSSRRLATLPIILCAACFCTARAADPGDAKGKPAGDKSPQVLSIYSNSNKRPDPLLPVRLKGKRHDPKVAADDREMRLQGILWHPTKPVAVVNRTSIALNESATLKLSTGEFQVKAIAIERDRAVLLVDDRQVELRLER
jgi:hypothetical protein